MPPKLAPTYEWKIIGTKFKFGICFSHSYGKEDVLATVLCIVCFILSRTCFLWHHQRVQSYSLDGQKGHLLKHLEVTCSFSCSEKCKISGDQRKPCWKQQSLKQRVLPLKKHCLKQPRDDTAVCGNCLQKTSEKHASRRILTIISLIAQVLLHNNNKHLFGL